MSRLITITRKEVESTLQEYQNLGCTAEELMYELSRKRGYPETWGFSNLEKILAKLLSERKIELDMRADSREGRLINSFIVKPLNAR